MYKEDVFISKESTEFTYKINNGITRLLQWKHRVGCDEGGDSRDGI